MVKRFNRRTGHFTQPLHGGHAVVFWDSGDWEIKESRTLLAWFPHEGAAEELGRFLVMDEAEQRVWLDRWPPWAELRLECLAKAG